MLTYVPTVNEWIQTDVTNRKGVITPEIEYQTSPMQQLQQQNNQ
jgi:hypothetical protein